VGGAIVGGIVIGLLQNLADGGLSHLKVLVPWDWWPSTIKEVAPFVFMVVFLCSSPTACGMGAHRKGIVYE